MSERRGPSREAVGLGDGIYLSMWLTDAESSLANVTGWIMATVVEVAAELHDCFDAAGAVLDAECFDRVSGMLAPVDDATLLEALQRWCAEYSPDNENRGKGQRHFHFQVSAEAAAAVRGLAARYSWTYTVAVVRSLDHLARHLIALTAGDRQGGAGDRDQDGARRLVAGVGRRRFQNLHVELKRGVFVSCYAVRSGERNPSCSRVFRAHLEKRPA